MDPGLTNPGVYEFTGDLTIEAGATLSQSGPVTIVLTDSAKLTVDGVVGQFSALGSSPGFAVYASDGGPPIQVGPNGSLSLTGAVYAPGSTLTSRGTVTIAGTTVLGALSVPGGAFDVVAPGDDVGLAGPHETALVR
jgi:hypothetical protein